MKKIIITTSIFLFALFFIFPSVTKAAATKKIGEFCSSNSECLTDDCEDNVCDCDDQGQSNSTQCATGLQSGSAQNWKCIDESQDPQKRGNDFCVNSTFQGGTYPNQSTDQVIYPISHKLVIGEKCETNDQCKSSYCEDSNLDGDYDNYCVCNSATNCQEAYGDTVNNWECRGNGLGSADDVNGLNYCYNKSTNKSENSIKVSVDNISLSDVILRPQGVADAFSSDIATIIKKPTLAINIPGLNFSEADIEKMKVTDDSGNVWLTIPYLGEYISAVYKYGVIVISLLAVFGIIISGVTLISGGGSSDSVTKAKKRITMSAMGLVVAVTSYTLLYLINPELVQFRNLKILLVKGYGYEPPTGAEDYSNEAEYIPSTQSNNKASTQNVQNNGAIDCSSFATPTCSASEMSDRNNLNCAPSRNACRVACLKNLPKEKRSTTPDGDYLKDYLGDLDCNIYGDGERSLSKIQFIVIHEGGSPRGAIGTWWGYQLSPRKELHNIGSHYFITHDGNIYQLLSEKFSIIQSRKSTNGIGIDLAEGPCPNNKCTYTKKQYDSIRKLIAEINGRVHKTLTVVGHCELNPLENKGDHIDPRNFDWSQLGPGYDNITHWRGRCIYPFQESGKAESTTPNVK